MPIFLEQTCNPISRKRESLHGKRTGINLSTLNEVSRLMSSEFDNSGSEFSFVPETKLFLQPQCVCVCVCVCSMVQGG